MTPKFCPNCGTKAPSPTSNFCSSCGQSLNTLTSTIKASRPTSGYDEEGSDVTEVPELDKFEVSISGDDDDEKYVQTLNSFSFTMNGGVTPRRFKPSRINRS